MLTLQQVIDLCKEHRMKVLAFVVIVSLTLWVIVGWG